MPQRTFIVPEFGFIAESNIEKPGLVKPKRTYNLETAYVGNAEGESITAKIGTAEVMLKHSRKDEMAVINNTSFFICKSCGYAEADKGTFSPFKNKEHKRASGFNCGNKSLQRYSLGYRFETDVTQIRFVSPRLPASRWDYAYSVLCGLQRGFCSYYGIDERDISGESRQLTGFFTCAIGSFCFGELFGHLRNDVLPPCFCCLVYAVLGA